MVGGVTRLSGLPGLLGRVTLPAGVAFCHVNVSMWGNPPTLGRFMLPKRAKSKPTTKRPPYWNRNNMSQSRGYQRGKLFRRVHLPSVERRNQDNNQEESEGIQISSDALSEGLIEAHATFLPRDQSITQSKRKASDVSANENHAAKETKKSPKNKTWTADQVERLLRYVKDFKTNCDFSGIDFDADPGVTRLHVNACKCYFLATAGRITVPHLPGVPQLHVNRPLVLVIIMITQKSLRDAGL